MGSKPAAQKTANLFDLEPAWVLWHRTGRRSKWRVVGGAETEAGALALVGTTGHAGGDWIIRPAGRDPNDDRADTAAPAR